MPALEEFIARAADAAEMFAAEGIEKVMNMYNPERHGLRTDRLSSLLPRRRAPARGPTSKGSR